MEFFLTLFFSANFWAGKSRLPDGEIEEVLAVKEALRPAQEQVELRRQVDDIRRINYLITVYYAQGSKLDMHESRPMKGDSMPTTPRGLSWFHLATLNVCGFYFSEGKHYSAFRPCRHTSSQWKTLIFNDYF
jgi:hypothetical protein